MKLIPTIYFYTLSLIGFTILLVGIFADVHYLVGITQYPQYPLGYAASTRCLPAQPMAPGGKEQVQNTYYNDCLKGVEEDRTALKTADLEKALSFTLIGLAVFGIHFSFARKQSK